MEPHDLNRELGNMDLFMIDQVLKARFNKEQMILDAGCGEGRNSYYFIRNGYRIYGVDNDPNAIRMVKMVARSNGSDELSDHFLEGDLRDLPFPPQAFDAVFSISSLHFAQDEEDFKIMMEELKRVLKPSGDLIIRMQYESGQTDSKFFRINKKLISELEQDFEITEPVRLLEEENGERSIFLVLKKYGHKKKA